MEHKKQGEPEAALVEWKAWRSKIDVVVQWAAKNEWEALAGVEDARLLGAQAALACSEHGPKSLADACIGSDAAKALMALLARPAWRAAVCGTSENWAALPAKLAMSAVDGRAPACLRALCVSAPGLAWSMAARCVEKADGPRRKGPWAEGFAVAVELAVGPSGELNEAEALHAVGTIERAMEAAKSDARLLPAVEQAIKGLMTKETARVDLSGALLRLACNPGLGRVKAWEMYGQMHPEGQIMPQPAGWFGLSAGRERLRSRLINSDKDLPFVVYPSLVDPSWVAALNAEDEDGVRITREMAGRSESEAFRPKLYPSVAALSHPLERAWTIWNHSKRAGFALPKKPLESARKQMREAMEQWSMRVGEQAIEKWREVGEAVFASLCAGNVPAEFPGFKDAPKTNEAERDMSRLLSPLALRQYNRRNERNESASLGFTACARASDALGSSLADYVEQARGVLGLDVDTALIAGAERAQLADMVSEGSGAKRSALRM